MISFKSKIFIAGHRGLVGSAIVRVLKKKGYSNLLFAERSKLDLKDQKKVYNYLKKNKPKFIFIAAAKVGGIYSNSKYKADFIYENLVIQTNLINAAHMNGIKNLIFLGSSCVYPKKCKQPIKEEYLLSGPLEPTNDAYAIAKIAGIKMCQSYNEQYNTNYKCLMPTNVFGRNDNYHQLNSHFVPALINKIHDVKINNKAKIKIWGDGSPKRELMYVEDLAEACVYFMNKKTKHSIINIGTGHDASIKTLTKKLLKILIPQKKIAIIFDPSKPNGTPRKILDISIAKKYGWKSKYKLDFAIQETYKNFLSRR